MELAMIPTVAHADGVNRNWVRFEKRTGLSDAFVRKIARFGRLSAGIGFVPNEQTDGRTSSRDVQDLFRTVAEPSSSTLQDRAAKTVGCHATTNGYSKAIHESFRP